MFNAPTLASHLVEYLKCCGIERSSEDFVSEPPRKDTMGIYVTFLVAASLSGSSNGRLDVILNGRWIDNSFKEFISEEGGFKREPQLVSVLRNLKDDKKYFNPDVIERAKDGGYRISGMVDADDSRRVFQAVLNRCLRPAWFYTRKHQSR